MWVYLHTSQEVDKRPAIVGSVMNLRVSQNAGNFMDK